MPINSKNILVVGGAGYIGSHMLLQLKQVGYTPIVLDNLSKGHRDAVLDTELITGEMADSSLLDELFAKRNITAVMHFASFIEVGESVSQPGKYYQNNVAATLNLLEAMVRHEVRHVIFSSSAAVYGEPQALRINEHHPIAPLNPYGRSKQMVEAILQDYAKIGALKYAILRYFNAAGADPQARVGERHDPESHLIPIILQVAAGKRQHATIFGEDYPTPDGTCIRDYVHVTDLCGAHLLALRSILQGKSNLIYNLGNGQGYSVRQVINAARRVTRHPIPVITGTRREGDPSTLVAETALIKQELNWIPRYSDLDTLIQHAWQFMQKA